MGKRKKKEDQEEQALSLVNVPGDLLPEILSRVPYQSLCRFKCVSMAWLKLCSDPAVRKRSPQTLSGFFCKSRGRSISFLNLSGRGRPLVDPSLSFLHGYEYVTLLNCCGGILLCSGWDRSMNRRVYLVCNPATQEIWAALPAPDTQHPQSPCVYTNYKSCLFFNPAVPGRFAVSMLLPRHDNIQQVEVYSSDTGEWASMARGWDPTIKLLDHQQGRICFLNGTLHFIAYYKGEDDSVKTLLVIVDMDGSAWRTISMPTEERLDSIIGQSQGHLYCMGVEHLYLISVWVLKDYASGHQDWTLKHSISVLELLGRTCRKPGELYWLVAIHPERNMLFLAGGVKPEETLMSYDMDSKKLNVICTPEEYDMRTFWPYTPCFAERPSAAQ